VLALLLSGCGGSLSVARGPSGMVAASPAISARCESLDARHRDWGSIAQGAAVLGGGSGLATLPLDGHEGAQLAVGVTGAVAAVVAAVAVAQVQGAAEAFARECK
jgi:hypothetical protein